MYKADSFFFKILLFFFISSSHENERRDLCVFMMAKVIASLGSIHSLSEVVLYCDPYMIFLKGAKCRQ